MPRTDDQPPELDISTEKVCYIIVKAREFEAKVAPEGMEEGSNPTDDDERIILEDQRDDPTFLELKEAIDDLNEDEAVTVIALAWLGRGDFSAEEWEDGLALARERHQGGAANYLIGMAMLGDYLEEGLAAVGRSCEDFELNRL